MVGLLAWLLVFVYMLTQKNSHTMGGNLTFFSLQNLTLGALLEVILKLMMPTHPGPLRGLQIRFDQIGDFCVTSLSSAPPECTQCVYRIYWRSIILRIQ
jgi:hypothetical protein